MADRYHRHKGVLSLTSRPGRTAGCPSSASLSENNAFSPECLYHQCAKQHNAQQRMVSLFGSSSQPRREAWALEGGHCVRESVLGGCSFSISATAGPTSHNYTTLYTTKLLTATLAASILPRHWSMDRRRYAQTCVEWSDFLVDAGIPHGACALGGSDPLAICWGRHCETGPVHLLWTQNNPTGWAIPMRLGRDRSKPSLWG